jgi:ankyrin repeat protein
VVQTLLDRGADPEAGDEEGDTALHTAAANDEEAVLSILIDAGAALEARNEAGETALHWAAATGSRLAAQLLLEHEADIAARDAEGRTPLHAGAHDPDMAALLLEWGADVDAKSDAGLTPVDEALASEQPEAVRFLLSRGADWSLHAAVLLDDIGKLGELLDRGFDANAADGSGNTALHYAAGVCWSLAAQTQTPSEPTAIRRSTAPSSGSKTRSPVCS